MTPAAAAESPDQVAPPPDGEPTAAAAGPIELPPPTPRSIRVAGGWYVPKLDKWGKPDTEAAGCL